MTNPLNESQQDFGVMWDLFVDHMSKQYGFEVKNVIGSVNKYRKVFVEAQRAFAEEARAELVAAAAQVEVDEAAMPRLPPYIYGRETGTNEKVWTEEATVAHGRACYAAGAAKARVDAPAAAHGGTGCLPSEPSAAVIEVCMRAMHTASQGDFDPTVHEGREVARAVLVQAQLEAKPLDMVLHCPECGLQHVDEPDVRTPGWENPPHRSHLCHGCQCIWRPADVATNGVRAVATRGKADSWPAPTPDMGGALLVELSEFMERRANGGGDA